MNNWNDLVAEYEKAEETVVDLKARIAQSRVFHISEESSAESTAS